MLMTDILWILSIVFGVMGIFSIIGYTELYMKLIPVKFVPLPMSRRAYSTPYKIVINNRIDHKESSLWHEWTHVGRAWKFGIFPHALLARFSKKYVRFCETEAYAASVKHGRPMIEAATVLQTYGYSTVAEAQRAIEKLL